MSSIDIRDLDKAFAAPVLTGVNLHVDGGEVSSILGSSGSGKTTLLRCIAGLLRPDSGEILLGDRLVVGPDKFVAPERRAVGLVPQEGSLFPHLDVAGNVGYGLRRGDRDRVDHLLDLVGLPGTGGLRPHELSGGMQQRVAVARALAPRPSIVLLDEPFSALDAALRDEVRDDVFSAIRADGATAVLVTHDQEEALAVSDRVAVLMQGRIAQEGTPEEVYSRPASLPVAQFVGETVVLPDGRAFRPEDLSLDGDGPVVGTGRISDVSYHGYDSLLTVTMDGTEVKVRRPGPPHARVGDEVTVRALRPGLQFPD